MKLKPGDLLLNDIITFRRERLKRERSIVLAFFRTYFCFFQTFTPNRSKGFFISPKLKGRHLMTIWNLEGMQTHLLICNGSSCMEKGGEEITRAIRNEIEVLELDQQIHTTRTRCNGRCKDACVVIAYPQGNWYSMPSEEHARALVQDLNHDKIQVDHLYSFEEGILQRTPQATAIKGISKNKS